MVRIVAPNASTFYRILNCGRQQPCFVISRIMRLRHTLNIPVACAMTLNRFCYLLLLIAAIGSLFTSHPFILWLLLINVLTLATYGADKMAARRAMRRVPEATLLVFGLIGGWPGAIIGQQLFRHKTQKQPFKTYFVVSVIVSISAMVAVYQLFPVLTY